MNTAPLHAELASLRELVVTLKQALDLSHQENNLLRQKIDSLVRRVFGSSSEKLYRAQLELLLQLPALVETTALVAVVAAPKASASRSRKDRTPRLPDNLPVVEEVIAPEPVKAAPERWSCRVAAHPLDRDRRKPFAHVLRRLPSGLRCPARTRNGR